MATMASAMSEKSVKPAAIHKANLAEERNGFIWVTLTVPPNAKLTDDEERAKDVRNGTLG